jgi:hypothetical protein
MAKQKSGRTVVGVSLSEEEIRELDRQRKRFGTDADGEPVQSRGGMMKLLWQSFGDDALGSAADARARAAAMEQAVAPLADKLEAVSAAWTERAFQRQKIGANANQITRFANTLLLRAREGGDVDEESVGTLVLVLRRVERLLEEQSEKEDGDQAAVAELRALLADARGQL